MLRLPAIDVTTGDMIAKKKKTKAKGASRYSASAREGGVWRSMTTATRKEAAGTFECTCLSEPKSAPPHRPLPLP